MTWSADGKILAFLSNRRGNPDGLFVLSLQKPAAPGVTEKPPAVPPLVEIDWDDIHLRAQVDHDDAGPRGAISPDGKRVAFRADSQGSTDLWVASTDGSQLTRLTNGNQRPQQITWSKRKFGESRSTSATTAGAIKMVAERQARQQPCGGAGQLSGEDDIRAEEEFTEMFDQSWRYLSENFYEPSSTAPTGTRCGPSIGRWSSTSP